MTAGLVISFIIKYDKGYTSTFQRIGFGFSRVFDKKMPGSMQPRTLKQIILYIM